MDAGYATWQDLGKSSPPEVHGTCTLQRERIEQDVLLALLRQLFIVCNAAMPILYVHVLLHHEMGAYFDTPNS